ncbi:MAG: hypothetical protein AABX66_02565 [Nanoarchaeota archaeon]
MNEYTLEKDHPSYDSMGPNWERDDPYVPPWFPETERESPLVVEKTGHWFPN